MKKIILYILLLSSNILFSQDGGSHLKTMAAPPKTVFFVGNSKYDKDGTNVFGRNYVPLGVQTMLNTTGGKKCGYNCYAVSGRTTSQLLTDVATRVIPYLRVGDVVVFTEATNTIGTGGIVDTAIAQTLRVRNLVWAAGCKFVVQGATACNGNVLPGYANITTQLQTYNQYFRNNPTAVDGFSDPGSLSQFDTDADCTNTTYYLADDQIHETNTGYDLIIPLTYAAVLPLL